MNQNLFQFIKDEEEKDIDLSGMGLGFDLITLCQIVETINKRSTPFLNINLNGNNLKDSSMNVIKLLKPIYKLSLIDNEFHTISAVEIIKHNNNETKIIDFSYNFIDESIFDHKFDKKQVVLNYNKIHHTSHVSMDE